MFDWLLLPLQYAFMVRGLLAAILVGVVCAVVGTYVVLRGMAFLAMPWRMPFSRGLRLGTW
jgi:manganese/iron transport system permease protein